MLSISVRKGDSVIVTPCPKCGQELYFNKLVPEFCPKCAYPFPAAKALNLLRFPEDRIEYHVGAI